MIGASGALVGRVSVQMPKRRRHREREPARLPDNIYDAIEALRGSDFVAEALGEEVRDKYAELKQAAADRCPRRLGALIKPSEIQFHHEVTNQYLWNRF